MQGSLLNEAEISKNKKTVENKSKVEFGLIIMNSKGHGKIKAFLMGSISYHVSRNAKCPVLLIR